MKTFEQFKKELGVDKITFMKSTKTGRQFATVGDAKIIIANKRDKDNKVIGVTDITQPLFVNYNEKLGIHMVMNSSAEVGVTL